MKGYKKKPLLIEVFALLYLLSPIGNILLVFIRNSHNSPLTNLKGIWDFIAVGNIVVILNVILWISAIPLSYGLYKVRLWAWYYFLIHAISMVALSFFNTDYDFNLSVVPLLNTVFLIPIGYFISKEIRTPYFNPRVRWWEQSIRFKHEVEIMIDEKPHFTFDISDTGAFVIDNGKILFKVGKSIPVEIHIDDISINCKAEIRWINTNKGKHPKGFGIKFLKLAKHDTKLLKAFHNLLVKQGKEKTR